MSADKRPSVEHTYGAATVDCSAAVVLPESNLSLLAAICMTCPENAVKRKRRFGGDYQRLRSAEKLHAYHHAFLTAAESRKAEDPTAWPLVPPISTEAPPTDEENCFVSASNTPRKNKSLGLLCFKFLNSLSEKLNSEIELEKIAQSIGAGKRRMYDIINVLESLYAVAKITKARYKWLGLAHLKDYMHFLKVTGEKDGWPTRVTEAEERLQQALNKATLAQQQQTGNEAEEAPNNIKEEDPPPSLTEKRPVDCLADKRTSLMHLSRRFLTLLLCSPGHELSMDVASSLLVGSPRIGQTKNNVEFSRCRRLYDIANILISLGLVAKVFKARLNRRYPLFKYCGPTNFAENVKRSAFSCPAKAKGRKLKTLSLPPKQKELASHASFKCILQVAELERERIRMDTQKLANSCITASVVGAKCSVLKEIPKDEKPVIQKLRVITKCGVKCYLVKVNKSADNENFVSDKRRCDAAALSFGVNLLSTQIKKDIKKEHAY